MTLGFIILRHIKDDKTNEYWKFSYDCVRRFYPETPIMIIDDNSMKQGLYSPGMSIPVVSIDVLDSIGDTKVAFVPLAWNFFKEISSKIKTKRDQEGDVFIKYFPTVSVN